MIKGFENVAIIYKICYKAMNMITSNLRVNPKLMNSSKGETMFRGK